MSNPKIVIVRDHYGENPQRINLTHARQIMDRFERPLRKRDWTNGVDLEGVYLQPRAQRVILCTDSRWEDRSRPGRCVGERWTIADNDTIARVAEEFDCEELAKLLPEFVDA